MLNQKYKYTFFIILQLRLHYYDALKLKVPKKSREYMANTAICVYFSLYNKRIL